MSIVQCVPNFSEGRNQEVIQKIVEGIQSVPGVRVLDYSSDKDHNRSVVTLVGSKEVIVEGVFAGIKVATELIDMTKHQGEHPRMGATDVVPFIPIKDVTMDECVELANKLGKKMGEELGIPVYLYEKAATQNHRTNLANIRKGEYEGLAKKMEDPKWYPDYGPKEFNRKSGATAVGARMPLVAFNVNLNTSDLTIAEKIAKNVRLSGGGLHSVKAMGVELKERGIVQVSMNMVDYKKTPLYRAVELIKIEAQRYGVSVVGSEIIGLVPMDALVESIEYYLGLEDFRKDQILENRLYQE
ncbi:glutamate formiminotransferase [Anaerobranca californiensis DSM 14826]|jgi:glutamate formiminotransferase|uniref:glutamate formimidoyltransferase n=1 Tax=Anaerobranca californiensis DSM 14826 TaxID=1120989 RepID=A0A1M6RLY6_9FIRM|nr:glutamate formimidoyltransferase [Anaerobranca californiensis]SHK33483.1 glutamate formiminotransferase [Anaerobranca californiensis DSM 14826]